MREPREKVGLASPAVTSPRRPLLERLALHRPELRAWALYDWGNSAFFTTVVATVFPVYFVSIASESMSETEATAHFSGVTSAALLVIAVLSPVLGALADARALRKRLLGVFLALGVAATAALCVVDVGDWRIAAVLFGLGNVGVAGTMIFYDGLLPHVAREGEVERLSTSAYALGYLGGGLLLAAQLLVITKPAWFGLPAEGTLAVRLTFLSVAVWWLVFAVPLLRRVSEPSADPGADASLRGVFARLVRTARELRQRPNTLLMLAAFVVYGDGIGTVFRMAAAASTALGFPRLAVVGALLLTQFVGVPAAVALGALAQRVGAKRTVLACLVVYVAACVLASQMRATWHLFALAGLVALVQGGAQALSRSLFASMVPQRRSAEFFGLFAVCDRVAGVAGPAFFGAMISLTGSIRVAMASIVVFFVVGGALLTRVDVAGGRRESQL